jgi:hypothetical protein
MARLRLHKGWQHASLRRLVEEGNDELKGYRGELGGNGMRNLRDLAVIVPRTRQVHHAMHSEYKLSQQRQPCHGDGDIAPVNLQPTRYPAHALVSKSSSTQQCDNGASSLIVGTARFKPSARSRSSVAQRALTSLNTCTQRLRHVSEKSVSAKSNQCASATSRTATRQA